MEKMDKLGIFWLSYGKEETLSGRLTFDPEMDGTRLELVGIFEQFVHRNHSHGADIRIHGWVDNQPVTLDRCFETGSNHRFPGPYTSSFYANELFVGHHIEGGKHFDSVIVSLEYLDVLLKTCGISERSIAEGRAIEFKMPASDCADFSRGAVSVGFSWETGGSSLTEASIRSKPYLEIQYGARCGFEEIQRDILHLESLVSICTGVPTVVDRVLLRRSDLFVTMISGRQSSIPQSIEYRAPSWGYVPKASRKVLYEHDLLLAFDELGGVDRVASWLDQATEVHRPISSLMSIMRTKHMFAENKFMNVTYAAEALHRIVDGGGHRMDRELFDSLVDKYVEVTPPELHQWLRDRIRYSNEPSLTKRLNQMAARVGPMIKPMIGRRERWAGTIAAVRNDITHLGSRDSGLDGGILYYLTESVFTVTQLYLLLQIGVPEEVLRTKLVGQTPFRQLDRVAASIDAARSYLRANELL